MIVGLEYAGAHLGLLDGTDIGVGGGAHSFHDAASLIEKINLEKARVGFGEVGVSLTVRAVSLHFFVAVAVLDDSALASIYHGGVDKFMPPCFLVVVEDVFDMKPQWSQGSPDMAVRSLESIT